MSLIDRTILEWAWMCEKGYPDLNNENDLKVFESKFGFNLLLNENVDLVNFISKNINGYGEISADTGRTNITLKFSEIPQSGPTSTELRKSVFDEIEELAKKENEITSYNYNSGGDSSVGFCEVTFRGKKYKIILKGVPTADKADTDIKEAFVSLFYVSDIASPFTKNNIESRANNLLSLARNGIPGENSQATAKVVNYLENIGTNNSYVKFINQPLSSALLLREAYPGGTLVRTGIFDEIRKKANRLTNLPADKWCPGDVYIQTGEVTGLDKIQSIENLNGLFNEEWKSTARPLTAISLKQQDAQYGKAKALLQKYTRVKDDYNLTKDEIDYDIVKYQNGIKRLRNKVEGLIGGNPNIIYNVDTGELPSEPTSKIKDPLRWLRGKYAALKSIEFLFRKFADDKVDNAMVAIAGFAMSLTGVNPAFFKVQGQSSGGDAKLTFFARGEAIDLYGKDEDSKEPIEVQDSKSFGGLKLFFKITQGGDPYSVAVNARSNGHTQGTIEIQNISKIG